MTNKTAYDFSFLSLTTAHSLPLQQFSGSVLLIVNTASRCGFTPQLADLESLYQKYQQQGLVIIGVPSNDFGKQEPGSHEEIADFCHINYGVTFPMTQKEHVIGPQAHPFYAWVPEVLGFGSAPKWNFHKYLISKTGEPITYFYPITKLNSKRFIVAIEKALSAS